MSLPAAAVAAAAAGTPALSTPLFGPEGTRWAIAAVACVVYLGMFLGGLPRLRLDRTGVALLGAIAVMAVAGLSPAQAAQAVDLPTLVLLFAFMILAAQLGLGGFYTAVTRRVVALPLSPAQLLGAVMVLAAALSAIFSNDVVCLAMTPLLARICLRRGLDPVPFLVGLACAANIGSAATLVGNPQNMLIGSVMRLSFGAHLQQAAVPVALALLAAWGWIAWRTPLRASTEPGQGPVATPSTPADDMPPFDRWQSAKGLTVAALVMAVFLATDWPRDTTALIGAGVLLLSRRLHSAEVMGTVDWPLLLLFIGLFIVNHALQQTGLAAQAVAALSGAGLSLERPAVLVTLGVLLSNLVSNVPAVMLLLPHLPPADPASGHVLALASTFAGNLLLIGSIANLIVADLAAREGVRVDAWRHARIGVPVTLLSLAALVVLHGR